MIRPHRFVRIVAALLVSAVGAPLNASPTVEGPDGAALFTQHCSICHIAAGSGMDFGPNLSDAGLRLTRDQIRESILDPSRTITEGFEQIEYTKANGQTVVGLPAPESAGQVIVKQLAGVLQRIPKDEIVSEKVLPVSAMAAVQKLAPAEIDAVVDYVLTQKTPVEHKIVKRTPKAPPRGAPLWLLYAAIGTTILFGFFAMRGRKDSTPKA